MSWQDDAVVDAPSWQKDEVVKPSGASQRGDLAEMGVAALRGAKGVGDMIRQGMGNAFPILKPATEIGGYVADKLTPDLSPSRPGSAINTFGELLGGSAAGGGISAPIRGMVLPSIMGTLGEQVAGKPGEIIGAVTAPAASGALVNKVRQVIADRIAPRMEMFRQAGTEPSVGQATELNFIQGFENLLSKFPGGQGIFRKFAENQQKQLGDRVNTGIDAEDAGRAVEKGVQGFIARSKDTWKNLDAEVAAKIPKGAAFQPSNTVAALDELTNVVPGAEKTTGSLINQTISKIKEGVTADLEANNGVMPYEAIRALRTKVGSMLDDSLVSGVPQGELKRLYGALSQDLEAAANKAGAGKEFARQNDYYRARMERIEGTLDRVLGKTPEETFDLLMPKNARQVTTIRAAMRSLDPEQRKLVTEAAVDRLGRAGPGKQDASGDVFSPETFLTNWNKLSDGAKAQLFSDPAMRKNLDAVAGVAENLRGGAKVFANPSGSAGAAAPYGMGYLLAVGNIATVGTLAGGAMMGAKMLTSPKFVEWLAQYPKVAPEAAALHLARLGVIFNETKDPELKQELGDFMASVQKK